MEEKERKHKDVAIGFLRALMQGRFKEGLQFFASDCKTHNPYIAGGMDALTDAMIAANREMRTKYPDAELTIRHTLADGDLVAVHTQLLNSKHEPSQGGLRQVHLFRFEGDKIVEYWDITQMVTPEMPNARGAF
jgi:predicted SnoaL-like aldol condensation-catalyzing enzyme